MPGEHRGMLCGVAQHQERLIAGIDREHGVTRRMARRRERHNAGRDFVAGSKTRHVFCDAGKYPALVAKSRFQVGWRGV
jgi:hypothetical protein